MNSSNQELSKAKIYEFIEASRSLVESKTAELVQQIDQLKEENERLMSKLLEGIEPNSQELQKTGNSSNSARSQNEKPITVQNINNYPKTAGKTKSAQESSDGQRIKNLTEKVRHNDENKYSKIYGGDNKKKSILQGYSRAYNKKNFDKKSKLSNGNNLRKSASITTEGKPVISSGNKRYRGQSMRVADKNRDEHEPIANKTQKSKQENELSNSDLFLGNNISTPSSIKENAIALLIQSNVLNLKTKLVLSRANKNLRKRFRIKELIENHQNFLNAKTLLFQTYLSDITKDLKDFFHLSRLSIMSLSFIKHEDEVAFQNLEMNQESRVFILPFVHILFSMLFLDYSQIEKEEEIIKGLYSLVYQKYGKTSLKEVFIKDFFGKMNELTKDEIVEIRKEMTDVYMKNELIFSSSVYLSLSKFCAKMANPLKYFFDLLNDYVEKHKMVSALENKIGKFVECSETLKKKKEYITMTLNKSH